MPSTSRPPDRRSSAAAVLASAAAPRTTGRATVVANRIVPLASITLARATIPSSHGRENTRWSLAPRDSNPSWRAAAA